MPSPKDQSSPVPSPSTELQANDHFVLTSPRYQIYKDKSLEEEEKSIAGITKITRDRLVRATVTNMCAVAYLPPISHRPSNPELEEMAKLSIQTYKSLMDDDGSLVRISF